MVKGVNKTIIEINHTGNAYFERAILFVDPDYRQIGEKQLHEEAVRFIGLVNEGNGGPGYLRKQARTKKIRKRVVLAIAALILLSAVLCFIF